MRIIRFDKLETKDHNYIKRHLHKAWFNPKKIAPAIFVKSCIIHIFQKKSWRHISKNFGLNHIVLYNFYNCYKENIEFENILVKLIENWIILYLDDLKNFSVENINEEKIKKSLFEMKIILNEL